MTRLQERPSALPSEPYHYQVPVEPASPWPTFRRDHRNTGQSPLRARRFAPLVPLRRSFKSWEPGPPSGRWVRRSPRPAISPPHRRSPCRPSRSRPSRPSASLSALSPPSCCCSRSSSPGSILSRAKFTTRWCKNWPNESPDRQHPRAQSRPVTGRLPVGNDQTKRLDQTRASVSRCTPRSISCPR